MRPKADLIRAKMIKYPKVYLWDKSNWTKEDLLKFKKLNIPTNRFKIKVLRVSDGFIYESIKKCMLENNFCKKTMFKKLKIGDEFQRVDNLYKKKQC